MSVQRSGWVPPCKKQIFSNNLLDNAWQVYQHILCISLSHFAPSIDLFNKKLIDNVGPSQGKWCFSNSQIWSINYPLKKIPSIFFQLMINESFGWNSFVFYKRAILGLFLVYFRFISNKVCGAGIWTHNLLNASLLP